MNEEDPPADVWERIRAIVHDQSSADAEELVEQARKSRSGFIREVIDFDPEKPHVHTGLRSFGELEAMAAAANDVANASRSERA